MKAGWKTKPVGEVCTFHNGLWTGKKPPFATAGVFRNTDFGRDGELKDGEGAVLQVEEKQLAKRRLQYADIILEKSGGGPKQAVGRVAFYDRTQGIHSFSNFTSAIRVNDTNQLLPQYLLKFLLWTYLSGVTEGMQSHSTGIRNLNANAYKQIEVPIPPLDEQRRIVAVLDKAFAGIATATANAQKNLTNARELFESTLSEIFDRQGGAWPQFPLSEAGKTITGNTPKTGDKENFGDFLPFIKPGNFLRDGSIAYDGDGLSEKGAQSSRIIPAGSALMVCIGATIGKSGFTERKVTANQQINAVVPKNGIVGKFLYYQFLTPSFQRSVRNGSGQATLPIISKSKWSDLQVRLPNSEQEQAIAVRTLDEISERSQQLIGVGRRKLDALSELKKSLLHKAFAGELT